MWEDVLQLDKACREKFITEQDFPELAEHGLRMGGASVLQGEYVVGRRDPDIHTLVFGVSGQGKAAIPGATECIIKPGDCLFLPARKPFQFEIDSAEWRTCWLLLPNIQRWAFLHERTAGVSASASCWSL
ncbi:MAG: cupin domain-containing protein, partial [Natronospirillum sp.]